MRRQFSLWLLGLLSIAFLPARAQTEDAIPQLRVQQQPVFPGGNDSLVTYFKRNLQYPAAARQHNLEGVVVTEFVIDKAGLVKDAKVIKRLGAGTDEEALRLLTTMPAWAPGRHNGNLVNVQYVLPIRFSLNKPKPAPLPPDNVTIYKAVGEMPQFPGGYQGLVDFIAQHLQYPMAARLANTEGYSTISFVINTDGSTSNYEIVKALGNGTDEEAIRVLQMQPKWRAGRRDGQLVRVQYTLPVKFSLKDIPENK